MNTLRNTSIATATENCKRVGREIMLIADSLITLRRQVKVPAQAVIFARKPLRYDFLKCEDTAQTIIWTAIRPYHEKDIPY